MGFEKVENNGIGRVGKYHNTLCLFSQILNKHCFQFFLGLTNGLKRKQNNAYSKCGRSNKEYYGISASVNRPISIY